MCVLPLMTKMIEIKEASGQEIEVIRQIAHETWPVAFAGVITSMQITYMLSQMYSVESLRRQMASGHQFLIAWEDEQDALGFLGYELRYGGLPTLRIHKIYVLPSAQGKGVGSLLIQEVTDIAREHHHDRLNLNVNRQNPSVGYYRHIGFEVVREEDIEIGEGYQMNDYVMEKVLS